MSNYLDIAIQAAREAGAIIKKDFFSLSDVFNKGKHDVVTETDLKSEKIILSHIRKNYPGHTIISEESGNSIQSSDYSWYVDPIDGTSNFITGNPYFTLSIGLAFQGEIIMGVVYNPVLDEMYTAEKSKGAFLNQQPIQVSTREKLSESLLATAWSAAEEDIIKGTSLAKRMALASRRLVINYAPALDLCNIARGRIDGLVDNGSTPEDHAAGSLILSEAGGKLQNLGKNSWDVTITGIIASNKLIHDTLEKLVTD